MLTRISIRQARLVNPSWRLANKGERMQWLDSHNRTKRRQLTPRLYVETLESRNLLDAAVSLGFVAQTYRDLLHREADAGGLAAFSTALENGTATRSTVALAIQGSPEYQA